MPQSDSRPVKFILVTGGVVSSLGKGLAAASIGALLEGHGYTVALHNRSVARTDALLDEHGSEQSAIVDDATGPHEQ